MALFLFNRHQVCFKGRVVSSKSPWNHKMLLNQINFSPGYSYTSEYYSNLEKELIGQAWIEIQNRPNQEEKVDNGSMKIIKELAKSFVRKLEVNQDGIVDESEFKSVIYYFINFIDPEVRFYIYKRARKFYFESWSMTHGSTDLKPIVQDQTVRGSLILSLV